MSRKPSVVPHLVLHLIVAIFLAFPIWVTSMLPTTWIDLDRTDGRVDLKAKTCLLFVIPFQTARIEGVERVETKPGNIKVNETEGPELIVLKGGGETVELLVSVRSAKKFKDRIDRFLSSSDSKLSLRSTAHRGVSIFCGLWAALFISIYVFYLLSWLVPHELQWRFLECIIERLPTTNRFRNEIEVHLRESGRG